MCRSGTFKGESGNWSGAESGCPRVDVGAKFSAGLHAMSGGWRTADSDELFGQSLESHAEKAGNHAARLSPRPPHLRHVGTDGRSSCLNRVARIGTRKTLDIYAHVLKGQQQATKVINSLFG